MPHNLTNGRSTLVPVMARCRQETSHYLSQCWPRSMSPYGITRPQWVKFFHSTNTVAFTAWFTQSNITQSTHRSPIFNIPHWQCHSPVTNIKLLLTVMVISLQSTVVITVKKNHLSMRASQRISDLICCCCWYSFEYIAYYSEEKLFPWGRVMHICVSKLNIIGSDNGLSPGRHQAIM